MKKHSLALLSFGLFSTALLAQEAASPQAPAIQQPQTGAVAPAAVPLADLYYLANGSIVSKRGNATSQVQAPVRLADGSLLTPGGTVTRPDGTRNQLTDGQSITPDGKIGVAPQPTGQESVAVDKSPGPVPKP